MLDICFKMLDISLKMLDIWREMLDIPDVGQNVQHFAGRIPAVIWWRPPQQNLISFFQNNIKLLLNKFEQLGRSYSRLRSASDDGLAAVIIRASARSHRICSHLIKINK